MEERQTIFFERKIKPILNYVGTIGAILMAIAYIAIVFVMIYGTTVNAAVGETVLFACINAIIGIMIMQFLKIQGITFAKNLPVNQEILKRYNDTKTKDKRFRSIKYFWVTSALKDIAFKGVSIAGSVGGIIYIVIKGTYDYTYILLAIINLMMFACFGLISLISAYDFFNEKHIPFIEEQLNETKRKQAEEELRREEERAQAIEAEVNRRVEMAKKELDKQRNDMVHSDRGSDLLESSMDMCPTCVNSESVVLDGSFIDHNLLGGTVHSSSDITDNIYNVSEEIIQQYKNMEEKEC